jgi:hypothetical protein
VNRTGTGWNTGRPDASGPALVAAVEEGPQKATPGGRMGMFLARDLNQPSSEPGVGHLEVGSTSNRPGGHENEEKNALSRQICGGLSHIGTCKRPNATDYVCAGIYKH